MFADVNMAAGRVRSFRRVGSLMRSKSEGTLIDLDESASITSSNLNGKKKIFLKHKHPVHSCKTCCQF